MELLEKVYQLSIDELRSTMRPAYVYELGRRIRNGVGVEKNEQEGWRLIRSAAEQGHPVALGECYFDGVGFAKSTAKGFKCYESAAEKKDALALYSLALCYASGNGVKKDLERAVAYLEEAIAEGYKRASYDLIVCCASLKQPLFDAFIMRLVDDLINRPGNWRIRVDCRALARYFRFAYQSNLNLSLQERYHIEQGDGMAYRDPIERSRVASRVY